MLRAIPRRRANLLSEWQHMLFHCSIGCTIFCNLLSNTVQCCNFSKIKILSLYILLLSIHLLCLKKVLIDRRNSLRYQRMLAIRAFFNRGNTEGTNSSKILCLMFVYFCFMWICVWTDFVVFWIVCSVITCVQSK